MKKKVNYLTALLAILIILQSCNQSSNVKPMPEPEPLDQSLSLKAKELSSSSLGFGFNLFKTIEVQDETEPNWMISPLSVSLALAMAYNGADGDTKTAMQTTLGFSNFTAEEINTGFKELSDALLDVDDKVDLFIANSIWYKDGFSVLPDFITTNQNYYDAEVQSLDFGNSSAKNTINNWVANNTNNKIPTIVDNINPNDIMFLINAIYFKGNWKYKFDPSKNTQLEFTYEDGSTQNIEMMSLNTKFKSMQNEEVKMVELPYGRGNWVMDLILPQDGKTANQIIEGLTEDKWNGWVAALDPPAEITVTVPPFKFEYEKSLNDALKQMGMDIAFDEQLADFANINPNADLFISRVKHKTFIEVNETGTVAAAATSVGVGVTSAGSFIIFNKPFLFAIREQTTGAILFIGKVGNPLR